MNGLKTLRTILTVFIQGDANKEEREAMRPIKTCSFEDCDNLVEGNTDYCGTHNSFLRKQAKQAKQVKIVSQPRKLSAKMAKDLQDYGVLRKIHLQEHPECEINLPGICDGQATTIHHCAKRGINLLKADTFKSACMSCHTYIETKMSAEERREKGLLLTKNETV